jgi:diadenosine tetraphosphate (Ap4A) HIT family hydrolase
VWIDAPSAACLTTVSSPPTPPASSSATPIPSRRGTLIISRRHVGSLFDLTPAERVDLLALLDQARADLEPSCRPDGYNVGINDGPAAGQTVPHLHIHLIPRYRGDQADPRGGVRWLFPDKADYWTVRRDAAQP